MHRTTITFDYEGIEHPDTCEPLLDQGDAFRQWLHEFECASQYLPDEWMFRILPAQVWAGRMREVLFAYPTDLTREEVCTIVQDVLFDKGGLSGSFHMSEIRVWRVRLVSEHIVRFPFQEDAQRWAEREADRMDGAVESITLVDE